VCITHLIRIFIILVWNKKKTYALLKYTFGLLFAQMALAESLEQWLRPSRTKFEFATTQPTTQNKTKQLGWCGIIIGKIKHTTPGPITF
jgi:hypothetical protein